jgi:hypothetical protein
MAPGPLVASGAEAYSKLEQLDTSDEMYVYTSEEIKTLLKKYNDAADYDLLMETSRNFTTENILERRGLK